MTNLCVRNNLTLHLVVLSFVFFSVPQTWAYETSGLQKSMEFQVIRNSDPSCEPTCPEWISASGYIRHETPERLREFFRQLGPKKLPLVIHSDGGDRGAAFEMGRMIRKHGSATAVGVNHIVSCMGQPTGCSEQPYRIGRASSADADCFSACLYVFAGGIKRYSGLESNFWIHRGNAGYYDENKGEMVYYTDGKLKRSVELQHLLRSKNYYKEMGIKPSLAEKSYEHLDFVRVTRSDVRDTGLSNVDEGVEVLTLPVRCQNRPLPENCIQR